MIHSEVHKVDLSPFGMKLFICLWPMKLTMSVLLAFRKCIWGIIWAHMLYTTSALTPYLVVVQVTGSKQQNLHTRFNNKSIKLRAGAGQIQCVWLLWAPRQRLTHTLNKQLWKLSQHVSTYTNSCSIWYRQLFRWDWVLLYWALCLGKVDTCQY